MILLHSIPNMVAYFLPSLIHPIICMQRGNFDTKTWFSANAMVVPFEPSTVLGWYTKLVLEIYFLSVFTATTIAILTFSSNCSFYITALRHHFDLIFCKLDSKIISNRFEEMKELKTDFSDIISLHARIMVWVSMYWFRESWLVNKLFLFS